MIKINLKKKFSQFGCLLDYLDLEQSMYVHSHVASYRRNLFPSPSSMRKKVTLSTFAFHADEGLVSIYIHIYIKLSRDREEFMPPLARHTHG